MTQQDILVRMHANFVSMYIECGNDKKDSIKTVKSLGEKWNASKETMKSFDELVRNLRVVDQFIDYNW